MKSTLFLLIGFPLLQASSFGGEPEAKADHAKSPLPAAPHYWDAKSWEKGVAATFWHGSPKNESATTSTVSEAMKHDQSRNTGQKQSSPTNGG